MFERRDAMHRISRRAGCQATTISSGLSEFYNAIMNDIQNVGQKFGVLRDMRRDASPLYGKIITNE
jgi:hypothetical protein